MKNFLIGLLGVLLLFAIGAVGYLAFHKTPIETEEVEEEKTYCLDSGFTNSMDAVTYCRHMVVQHYYDSIFMHMPEETVENVAYVLISKTGQTTKEEIVEEYVDKQDTYDALYKRRCEKQQNTTISTDNSSNEADEQNTNMPQDSMKEGPSAKVESLVRTIEKKP